MRLGDRQAISRFAMSILHFAKAGAGFPMSLSEEAWERLAAATEFVSRESGLGTAWGDFYQLLVLQQLAHTKEKKTRQFLALNPAMCQLVAAQIRQSLGTCAS
jgi:hypothetical protein